jgi:elongation factor 1 alpha-like protein
MDESAAEREHGVTINITSKVFHTTTKTFTILDAPGHNDFISEMINGATQADVALLVIPDIEGEFESALGINAQTREHAILMKALGIDQIIIAVNKMDKTTPSWSKDRYFHIKTLVEDMFADLQYNPSIRFIPISGLSGNNIVTVEKSCELNNWYNGDTLFQLLDNFKLPSRHLNKPLRGIITTIVSETSKGYEVAVTIIQGRLRTGRTYAISGSNIAIVKKISNSDDVTLDILNAGQCGKILLIDKSSGRSNDLSIKEGYIISKTPITKSYKQFKATIATMPTLPLDLPLIPGTTFEIFIHGEAVQCVMSKIYSYNSSAAEIFKKPKFIPPSCIASVQIEIIDKAIGLELFSTCHSLGRFVLRAKGKTCCFGVISKLVK